MTEPAITEPNIDEFLVTETKASRMLGVSRRFLQRGRVNGTGPKYIQLGTRTVRYRLKDLEKFINKRKRGGEESL